MLEKPHPIHAVMIDGPPSAPEVWRKEIPVPRAKPCHLDGQRVLPCTLPYGSPVPPPPCPGA